MDNVSKTPPFVSLFPAKDQVLLTTAPLIKVLAQIKFENILSIQKDHKKVADFQQRIHKDFPVLIKEPFKVGTFDLKNETIVSTEDGVIYRFHTLDAKVRVSLSGDFIALETSAYKSRQSFLGDLMKVLEAFVSVFEPQIVNRVGIRYIDRVPLSNVDTLKDLLRPQLFGVLSLLNKSMASATVTEAVFHEGDCALLSKWGLLPPGGTIDPSVMSPLQNSSSWFLDIDTSQSGLFKWEMSELHSVTNRLAISCYNYFRWFVTDEFIREFGGDLNAKS